MDDTIVMLISIWLRVALCLLTIQIMRISNRRALWALIAGFYLFFAISRISQFTDSLFNDIPLIESESLMLNVAGDFLLATSMLMLSLFSHNIINAQKRLIENEEQLKNLFAHMKSGAVILTPMAKGKDFLIHNINQAGCELDKLDCEKILKKTLSSTNIIPSTLFNCLQRVVETGDAEYIPEAFCGSNSDEKWRDFYIYKLPSSGHIVLIYSDLTERKMAEEQRTLLEAAIEHAYEAIIITDPAGIVEYTNPSFERMLGYSREDILNRKISIIKSHKHTAGFYTDLWKKLNRGENWQGDIINRKKNGDLCENEVTISAIRSQHNDQITHYVSVQRDITQEAELKSQLLQSQKMEAIGALAGGIAHDFNNILFALTGYAELSLRHAEKGSEIYQNLQQILQAGARATDLVKQILSFSRQEPQVRKPLSIQHIAKETTKLLCRSLPPTITIQEKIDINCEMIEGDPTQIHQVLMNLCTNAYQAMRQNGGILTVKLSQTELHESIHFGSYNLAAGKYIELVVSDTGCGMDIQTQERIFDPYFTTKRAGEGTGLGLTVVHSIIDSHKGHIFVESEPGKGTDFRVLLPAIIEQKTSETHQSKRKKIANGTGRILLVDDDESVLTICEKMLSHIGYKITTLSEPKKALELFRKDPNQFDLVISDQVMPTMFGIELLQDIRTIRHDIPTILMSGYTSEASIEAVCAELGINQFLSKPVNLQMLADTTQRLIELSLN
jgi:PAS domain S-box-containing protein